MIWGNKMKRFFLATTIFVLLCPLLLSGCVPTGREMQAADFVEQYGNAVFYNEIDDDFLNSAGFTKAQAEALHSEAVDAYAAAILGEADEDMLNNNLLAKKEQTFAALFQLVRFDVSSAKENGDTFLAEISIDPVMAVADIDMESFQEEMMDSYDRGNFAGLSATELYLAVYEASLAFVAGRIEENHYGETVTIEIQLSMDEDGVFSVDKDSAEDWLQTAISLTQ